VKKREKLRSYAKSASRNPKMVVARGPMSSKRPKGNVFTHDLQIKESPMTRLLTGRMGVTVSVPTDITTRWGMYHLNRVPLVIGNQGRNDKSIRAKSVQIRGVITCGAAIANDPITLVLVWDREREERNVADFTLGSIFQASAFDSSVCDADSLTKVSAAPRFKILKRQSWGRDAVAAFATSEIVFDWFVRLKDKECSWDGTEANGDAIAQRKGVLILCAFSGYTELADANKITFSSRFYYDPTN